MSAVSIGWYRAETNVGGDIHIEWMTAGRKKEYGKPFWFLKICSHLQRKNYIKMQT